MADLDARTGLYLLIGSPVDHSLSPAIHNAALEALSLNDLYLAAAVESGKVEAALEGVRALGVKGLNVTSPHKEAVLPHLDTLSKEAEAVRSVNTIINRSGRLEGHTTDGDGFYRYLLEIQPAVSLKRVLLIGAGGAARSVAYAAAAKQPGISLSVVNRGKERGEGLVQLLGENLAGGVYDYRALDDPDLSALISESTLVIYSLPAETAQFMDALGRIKALKPECCLVDLRYAPRESETMKLFAQKGGRSFNGLGMLYWQAVLSFELFTGRQAPHDEMRAASGLGSDPAKAGEGI